MSADPDTPPQSLGLGRLVRMRALPPSELPAHAELASQQSSGSPPELQKFVTDAIEEAERFMTGYLPQNFKTKSKDKQSPPSAAVVELLSHEIRAGGVNGTAETWFARTSTHENAAKAGTANWEEFDQGLRVDHSQHEMDYTPNVYDANHVLDWSNELEGEKAKIGGWEDVHVSIMEMVHRIPTPLNDRVFPIVVVTAKKAREFIVVQIPVDSTMIPSAKYGNKNSKVTTGMYCSVERGELVEADTKVKWQMATASDAKGVLPMWAQKLGVPAAVVKDVGLFIEWCGKRRAHQA